jgi:hypothetical protein
VYTVMRPVVFNGIPAELTERTDLASRTIQLEAYKLAPSAKRSDRELKEEFEKAWPGIFGALLDGLVGALRDQGSIRVADPARLIDFERFAEAGCPAVGFKPMTFVNAYEANRQKTLSISLSTDAVGQAVLLFMQSKAGASGFAGQMEELKFKLDAYRYSVPEDRNWPKDSTRLSTRLDRITKALATAGIECRRVVDRRSEGGTQRDVVLSWRKSEEASGNVTILRRRFI